MAVAAVSTDTVRSFSPPAATFLVVSVTARLLLAAGGSHGRGIDDGGAQRRARVQGICCVQGVFPPRGHAGGELRKRLLLAVGPLDRPKLPIPRPLDVRRQGNELWQRGEPRSTRCRGRSRGAEVAGMPPLAPPGQ